MIKKLFLTVFLIGNLWNGTAQIRIPERPAKIPFIIDSTSTLSLDEQSILNNKLKNYCLSTSTEILVMMVGSTHGNNIEAYAKELGQKWGIGKLGKDNGMILLIAKDDRKMSIQNGHGIEPLLSNKKTKQIIDEVITPQFKNGNFFIGISDGLNAVFDILKNEFTNEKNATDISNFITDLHPPAVQEIAEKQEATEEGESIGLAGAVVIIVFFLSIFLVIVFAIITAIRNRNRMMPSGDYTMGGYGVNNTVYNHVHVNNNNHNNNGSSYRSSSSSSFYSGSSSSGSSSASSSGSSSGRSSNSGSGGTFGGGGASGGW